MDLEYPLVRVPYERLSNVFKNSTKSIEKDIGLIIQSVQQLAKKKDVKKSEGLVLLEKFSQRLELLKKKVRGFLWSCIGILLFCGSRSGKIDLRRSGNKYGYINHLAIVHPSAAN
jgi:hypothetical protein